MVITQQINQHTGNRSGIQSITCSPQTTVTTLHTKQFQSMFFQKKNKMMNVTERANVSKRE
mgnify:CR=1 FL=1